MGTGFHGGFGNTKGANDNTEKQESALIAELEKNGIKFTKEDIVFITKERWNRTNCMVGKGQFFCGIRTYS